MEVIKWDEEQKQWYYWCGAKKQYTDYRTPAGDVVPVDVGTVDDRGDTNIGPADDAGKVEER